MTDIEYKHPDYDTLVELAKQTTQPEHDPLSEQQIKDLEMAMILNQRMNAYPPLEDFADAWVKDDQEALEAYRQACLAVKAQYPKP